MVARIAARRAREIGGDPGFRLQALRSVLPHLPSPASIGDGSDWPAALHKMARGLRHVREPGYIGEILVAPQRVIELGAGDCDDVALLVGAISYAVGLPAAMLSIWTGETTAHLVCAVGRHWYGPDATTGAIAWVVDPEAPSLAQCLDPPYRYGRLFAV